MTMTITAQDFSTTELVEALTARGYFVRTLSHLDALNEAIAAERERAAAELAAMRARLQEAADQLDAAAKRIGELVAERDMAQVMIEMLNDDLALVARERNDARAEAVTERAELSALTSRMEAAIAEACAAVRARTIEECAAIAQSASRRAFITSHGKAGADMADAIHTAIRALATPTLTTEPAPVDPAAGALR